jgi:epoxyqueuosine reductase
MSQDRQAPVEEIVEMAHRLGFDLVGILPAAPSTTAGQYQDWLEHGYHGQMAYLARSDAVAKRRDPTHILPGTQSVVVVGANYNSVPLSPEIRDDPTRGVVASFAWGDDYHEVLTPRLRELGASVEALSSRVVTQRAYVDTGAILEREVAARAGLGFIGKNTNLIHPRLGSWFFLGELLIDLALPPLASAGGASIPSWGQHAHAMESAAALNDKVDALLRLGTCGRCTRCLDACPTNAFVGPYVLDARRCISYLTIELKGPIPRHLRALMGNRVFGCDICQEVCPWNRRFAQPTSEPAFRSRPGSIAPRLLDLIAMDEASFRQRFRKSPLKRAKRRGLLRNVAVALGNWGHPRAVPALARALRDVEPLIRGHAAWALGQIGGQEAEQALVQALQAEADSWVRDEIQLAAGLGHGRR